MIDAKNAGDAPTRPTDRSRVIATRKLDTSAFWFFFGGGEGMTQKKSCAFCRRKNCKIFFRIHSAAAKKRFQCLGSGFLSAQLVENLSADPKKLYFHTPLSYQDYLQSPKNSQILLRVSRILNEQEQTLFKDLRR